MKKLLAEVNISEGIDQKKIEAVKNALMESGKLELMDENSDKDHNRTVFTFTGEPQEVLEGAKRLAKKAVELIDMRTHKGSHPRMGAVDVVPFIPVKDVSVEEAVKIAEEFGKFLGGLGVPVFFYEDAARRPERKALPDIRKGEYEALKEKFTHVEWTPDEGPFAFNEKSGATVTGVRFPLVAFNVNIATTDLDLGKKIVKAVRGATGGYQNVRAIALAIPEKNMVQISMNLVNYEKSPVHRVFETIKSEADSYGVRVLNTELVGPVPMEVLQEILRFYLRVEGFSTGQLY